jgi:hypothetical protein
LELAGAQTTVPRPSLTSGIMRRSARPGVPLLKVTSGRALTKSYDRTERAMHNTQFGPFLGTNRSPDGSVRILLPIARRIQTSSSRARGPRPGSRLVAGEVFRSRAGWVSALCHEDSLDRRGADETVAEKTRPSAEPAARGDLYKIKYHRGTSQIHHQAAPSRAQAAGAVVIGRS